MWFTIACSQFPLELWPICLWDMHINLLMRRISTTITKRTWLINVFLVSIVSLSSSQSLQLNWVMSHHFLLEYSDTFNIWTECPLWFISEEETTLQGYLIIIYFLFIYFFIIFSTFLLQKDIIILDFIG